MLNICFFGTGYVGLVSGTCFAEMDHNVICCDIDQGKIDALNSGVIPIYEPGLTELVQKNIKNKRLKFILASKVNLSNIDLCVIAVGTPNTSDGHTDLSYVNSAVEIIKEQRHDQLTVMVKSTVPLGTCKDISQILNENFSNKIDVVSNPEFLREGSAVNDFLCPERIVLGFFEDSTKKKLEILYQPLANKCPIIYTDCATSELIKYASNAFLSAKVAFINEMAHICEKIGADIKTVSHGMGLDSRIGNKFLAVGPGFGGSCFPKDIQALKNLTNNLHSNNKLISSIEESNNAWKLAIATNINKYANQHNIKSVTFWGVTYKANTDDVRSSAVIDIISYLLERNIEVTCYDPQGLENLKQIFKDKINYEKDLNNSAVNSGLIIVTTEWEEFSKVDYRRIKNSAAKTIFDLRNIINKQAAIDAGYKIYELGQQIAE